MRHIPPTRARPWHDQGHFSSRPRAEFIRIMCAKPGLGRPQASASRISAARHWPRPTGAAAATITLSELLIAALT